MVPDPDIKNSHCQALVNFRYTSNHILKVMAKRVGKIIIGIQVRTMWTHLEFLANIKLRRKTRLSVPNVKAPIGIFPNTFSKDSHNV
jgi:hypothetical protein